LRQAALRLLASREHSRAELLGKLKARSGADACLEPLLDALEAERCLSDRRYAEGYIESRRRKGYGPLRIHRELGVDVNLIDELLDETDTAWNEHLQAVCRKKFGARAPADYRERAKRARFLEYRGFAVAQIRNLLWEDE
jgi:regulatory protein